MPLLELEGVAIGDQFFNDSQVNLSTVVTLPAPGERMRWLITGIVYSTSAAPAAAVSATVVSGATTLSRIEFLAASWWPFESCTRLRGNVNTAVVVTLPALGLAVRGTIALAATKVPA